MLSLFCLKTIFTQRRKGAIKVREKPKVVSGCVHIVIDPSYGFRLLDFPENDPVWVVDSRENHLIIRELWQKRRGYDDKGIITSFKYDPKGNPEKWLLDELDAIDLHHGQFSQNPEYSVLKVYGLKWSEDISREFQRIGFGFDRESDNGFIAKRIVNANAP